MGRIKKDWIDPIDIFIGRQLASPWREHQLHAEVVHKTKSWAWCPHGLTPLYVKDTFSMVNTIEDDIIYALDKAHKGVDSRTEAAVDLMLEGYRIQEIADQLGVHRRTIWNDLKHWSDTHDEEDEERLRAIASYLSS